MYSQRAYCWQYTNIVGMLILPMPTQLNDTQINFGEFCRNETPFPYAESFCPIGTLQSLRRELGYWREVQTHLTRV